MRSLKLILTHKEYFSPAWVFTSLNILIGTWAIYIPVISRDLGIEEGALGVSLFFFALGTMISIPASPSIIARFGVGRVTLGSIVCFCVAAILPFLADTHLQLSMALFLVGATSGLTDIAMNTLVSEIEAEKGVKIMSAAHGFFSVGGVIGAGLGSVLMPLIPVAWWHMGLVVIIVLILNLVFARYYVRWRSVPEKRPPFQLKILRPLFALGLISFIVMASEGAVVDWSGLYLEKITGARAPLLIGMGYTAFSVCMTLGRFYGDSISQRWGALVIIINGLCIAILGYLVILTGNTVAAVAGFGLLGLGFSVIIPELFRLGGGVSNITAAQGVSFIAGTGYVGFLTGPVVLGFLAEWSSLKVSYLVLLAMAIIACLTAWFQKRN